MRNRQAQGIYRGVLLGTGYREIVTQNRFTFALLTLDLGYAPLDRLSAALRYSRLSHDPHPQLSQTEQETLALSVAYRF